MVKNLLRAGGGYALSLVAVFFPFFFLGKTFLSTDVYLMAYKPFSADFHPFMPFNHFEDDILRCFYLYQWGAQKFLYQPYWIPEIFGGIPLYANTYASHFSTLNWILGLGPLYITYPLKLLCFLWIAGISMFSLVSSFRISFFPALLSGLAYMFSSLFITTLLRYWIPGAYCWMPLLLLFTHLGFVKGNRWALVLSSLFLAFSFFDGFFQTSASIVIAYALVLGVWGWQKNRLQGLLKATGIGFFVFVFAMTLSAVMWIPQLEYFWWEIASGKTRFRAASLFFGKTFLEHILSLPFLIGAFFPQALGSVHTMDLTKIVRGHLQDFSLFIGTVPLLLGLSGGGGTKKQKENSTAFLALALAGIVVPILTPLDRFLYYRFFAVYILGMSVLSAMSFETLLNQSPRHRLKKVALSTGILWVSMGLAALSLRLFIKFRPEWFESRVRNYVESHVNISTIGSRNPQWLLNRAEKFVHAWSLGSTSFTVPFLLTGAAVGICYLWSQKKIRNRTFALIALGMTLLQLWFFAHDWLPFHSLKNYPLFPDNEISQFMRENEPDHQYRASVNDLNGVGKESQIIPANTNFFFNYYTLEGLDGLRPATIYDTPVKLNEYDKLGKLNVKYIFTNPLPSLVSPHLKLRQLKRVAIYENLLAKPRARIFYSSGMPAESTKIIKDEKNSISYWFKSEKPGVFVASETFYPGWKAVLNGQPVEILQTHFPSRAVEVPAGESILEFHFAPKSYFLGLWISAAAATLIFFYLLARFGVSFFLVVFAFKDKRKLCLMRK